MRKLRERQFDRHLKPWPERLGLAMWGWTARRPAIYAMMAALGARLLSLMGGSEKLIQNLPLGAGWTAGRDLPAPEGRTFRALYARSRRGPNAE